MHRRLRAATVLIPAGLLSVLAAMPSFSAPHHHAKSARAEEVQTPTHRPMKNARPSAVHVARTNAAGHTRSSAGSRSAAPDLKSNSFYVLDEASQSVVLAKQADVPMPIASITKLMTALVVVEAHQPMDEVITVVPEDRGETAKTSTSRLEFGTSLSRGDLLHLALMASENRAAHALGRTYPGGISACVAAMNAKAKALGMNSAHFVEPTGLDNENVASPEDLAKLVRAASTHQVIQEYSTDPSYTVSVKHRGSTEFHNTDALVKNPTWNIIVQKTGYIAEAGRCLVMRAVVEGRSVIIVLLDSAGKYTRVADAQRVRQWLERQIADPSRTATRRGN
jgi:D-alanyl-D-alanine endopeptidase (penicillin-binding protein 7)